MRFPAFAETSNLCNETYCKQKFSAVCLFRAPCSLLVKFLDVVIRMIVEDVVKCATNFSRYTNTLYLRPSSTFSFRNKLFDFFSRQLREELLWIDKIETWGNVYMSSVILSHDRVEHTHCLTRAWDLAEIFSTELFARLKHFSGCVTHDRLSATR